VARSLWRYGIFRAGAGFLLSAGAVLTAAQPAAAATIVAHVTTQTGAAAESAVVTVARNGQAPTTAKSGTHAVMIQQDRQFAPFVLPVQLGTTVAFPNRDPFRHQVYSFSAAKPFELKLYGGNEVNSITFDKEGVVALGCNIHDNMLAYIYVVGTPYFALSSKDGAASLTQVPAGSYTVKVWHPSQKGGQSASKDITLAAGDTANVDIQIEMKRERKQRKPGAVDEKEY
jgi:plastocyanin